MFHCRNTKKATDSFSGPFFGLSVCSCHVLCLGLLQVFNFPLSLKGGIMHNQLLEVFFYFTMAPRQKYAALLSCTPLFPPWGLLQSLSQIREHCRQAETSVMASYSSFLGWKGLKVCLDHHGSGVYYLLNLKPGPEHKDRVLVRFLDRHTEWTLRISIR